MKEALKAAGWMILGAFILMCLSPEKPGRYQMRDRLVLDTKTGTVKVIRPDAFGQPFQKY